MGKRGWKEWMLRDLPLNDGAYNWKWITVTSGGARFWVACYLWWNENVGYIGEKLPSLSNVSTWSSPFHILVIPLKIRFPTVSPFFPSQQFWEEIVFGLKMENVHRKWTVFGSRSDRLRWELRWLIFNFHLTKSKNWQRHQQVLLQLIVIAQRDREFSGHWASFWVIFSLRIKLSLSIL